MANKIIAIIQARMGSKRFPEKMMSLLNGKPLICHVIEKVKQVKIIDEIVLATSINEENKILIIEAMKMGIKVFRGSEDDVLDRYYKCAKEFNADIIIRITGDCPLIDTYLIWHAIMLFKENRVDFVSNINPPTFPDGMDIEVFSFNILEEAWGNAKLKSEREHVDPYIIKKSLSINFVCIEDLSFIRLTVDEKEDLIFLNKLFDILNDYDCNFINIIKIIRNNMELLKINNKYKRDEGYKKCLELEKEK